MKNIENKNISVNLNASYGVSLESKASSLTQGKKGLWAEGNGDRYNPW